MRYALKVQYIGKNYAGSQLQAGSLLPTIQGELERALSTLIKCDSRCEVDSKNESPVNADNKRPIKTIFSGRTDKGVNSVGQVVHFDSNKPIVASKFMYSLNEILPADISVTDLKEVDSRFHAQKSAMMRIKYEIDIDRMQKALDYIKGEHDFSSFKSSGTLNPSTVCFIYSANCRKVDDKVIIDIIGNRFLYNMVRTIVGTLLEIEGHNLCPEHMKDVLDAKDRRMAGQNVSPYGLTLVEVIY